jgi:hypothetical protein
MHAYSCACAHVLADLKPGNVLLKSSRADRRGFVAKVGAGRATHDDALSDLCYDVAAFTLRTCLS